MIRFFSLLSLLLLPQGLLADEPARCYQFQFNQSPEAAADAQSRSETWCYRNIQGRAGSLFVYNGDHGEVRPELAFTVGSDGVITHGSLAGGKVTTHKVRSEAINPFPVPLTEPENLPAVEPEPSLLATADAVLATLDEADVAIEQLAITEGTFSASASSIPWRGYWWPYQGQPLSNGVNSPLGKFDRFVQARTGSNPGARPWEHANHRFRGTWWEGHCNGWAAAAIMRPEPRVARRDASGITFSVSDQKGLLAENDYCANVAFFGNRNYGRPGDDPRDIRPHVFHRAITYHIGSLRKGVAYDYRPDPVVDTHVISGYNMTIRRAGGNAFHVTVRLTSHRYDGSITNVPGPAPAYTRIYSYTLQTDGRGNAVSGTWQSENPDFLWVPLSPMNCSRNNQRMQSNWVETVLRLPTAAQ
jgi:hypothetical protein